MSVAADSLTIDMEWLPAQHAEVRIQVTEDESAALNEDKKSRRVSIISQTLDRGYLAQTPEESRALNKTLRSCKTNPEQTFDWLDPKQYVPKAGANYAEQFGKVFIHSMILANSIQLGASIELAGPFWDDFWQVCDHCFACIFLSEMAIKLVMQKKSYFSDRWNVLECILAWHGAVDTWILPVLLSQYDTSSLDLLKLFRLFRLPRMLKLLRMRRELRVLMEGMLDSIASMFWVGLLLLVIIYTFAIFCITVIGDSLPRDSDTQDYFGRMAPAMLSLFNVAVLTDWSPIAWAVFDTYPAVTLVLIFFVIITSCGLLNLIIGLIVERTTAAASALSEEDKNQEKVRQLDAVRELTMMMCELDADGDEWLTLDEMAFATENRRFAAMLQQIQLPLGFTLKDLYMILDQDGNERVSRKEFVDGMYRFVNGTEFQRICMNHLAISQLKRQVKHSREELNAKIEMLRQEQQEFAAEVRTSLNLVVEQLAKLQDLSSNATNV